MVLNLYLYTVESKQGFHLSFYHLVVVARFLALLDLYRQGTLRFNQVIALGDLQISWTGAETGEIETTDEFDIPVVLEDETKEIKGTEE